MKKGEMIEFEYEGNLHTGVLVSNNTCLKHSSVFQVLKTVGNRICPSQEYLISQKMVRKIIGSVSQRSLEYINEVLRREHGIGRKSHAKGDVYYANLPIIPGTSIQGGLRPVIIVSDTKIGKYVRVVPCTSQVKNNLPTHFKIHLAKPSTVLCESEMTIPSKLLVNVIGSLNQEMIKKLDKCICIQHDI